MFLFKKNYSFLFFKSHITESPVFMDCPLFVLYDCPLFVLYLFAICPLFVLCIVGGGARMVTAAGPMGAHISWPRGVATGSKQNRPAAQNANASVRAKIQPMSPADSQSDVSGLPPDGVSQLHTQRHVRRLVIEVVDQSPRNVLEQIWLQMRLTASCNSCVCFLIQMQTTRQ